MKTPRLLAVGTTNINMTPMIDVVFLLIIFFLVSSHLAKQETSVKLALPTADSGLPEGAPLDTIVVNVLPDGSWRVGGAEVDEPELTRRLFQRLSASDAPLRLKIRTDQTVTYGRLEPILRSAAAAGIGDIVFSVYESTVNR